ARLRFPRPPVCSRHGQRSGSGQPPAEIDAGKGPEKNNRRRVKGTNPPHTSPTRQRGITVSLAGASGLYPFSSSAGATAKSQSLGWSAFLPFGLLRGNRCTQSVAHSSFPLKRPRSAKSHTHPGSRRHYNGGSFLHREGS